MPLYNCASTVAAIDVDAKWLDNVLSHNKIDGVTKARQGIPRRLSTDAIAQISLAHILQSRANIPIGNALDLASQLLQASNATLQLTPILAFTIDRAALYANVTDRLASAIEVTPAPKRGRPPRR